MKITNSDYQTLKDAAAKVKEANPQITPVSYVANKIGKDHHVRFCWDLFWSAKKYIGQTNYYDYLNDSHIETAMKKIVRELY